MNLLQILFPRHNWDGETLIGLTKVLHPDPKGFYTLIHHGLIRKYNAEQLDLLQETMYD
jgi:hypothetical protein